MGQQCEGIIQRLLTMMCLGILLGKYSLGTNHHLYHNLSPIDGVLKPDHSLRGSQLSVEKFLSARWLNP